MPAQLTRDQVPEELTWNLADLYASAREWEADVARIPTEVQEVTQYRGKLDSGSGTVLSCLRASDQLAATFLRVSAYASLGASADATSASFQAMSARAMTLGATV